MTAERWRQIEELYHAARERDPREREVLLAQATAEVRGNVEALLAQDASGGKLLDRPAAELLEETTVTQLGAGAQLGPYKIEAPIGAGGMGSVYRAVDTRLGRKVAIKISSQQFSERFEREARAISSLNHPHICTLYDVGPNYLVMEMVEGETLTARLQKGRLAMPSVLRYAAEIADALAAAHALGIVHRDLKPGNVMIAKSGVKVLDFGLAKSPGDETLTASRVVMGTPAYMAPEQREGKVCDARSDIYALGLVLYEMASGRRLPQGQSPSMENLPPQLAHVIERCLESEPENRWQSAFDVNRELEWTGKTQLTTQSTESRKGLPRWIWGVTVSVLGLALVAAGAAWFLKPKPEQPMLQMEITPPEGAKFVDANAPFALSPDGRRIAFLASGKDGERKLWLRSIDSSSAIALAGTENANAPFWSPDSRWVGFSTNGDLQKVDVVAGGRPQVICDIEGGAVGGTWNSEGVIVFSQAGKPLQRVSAAGGNPTAVLSLDAAREEAFQYFPHFLPDGRHLLYQSDTREHTNSMLASLDGKLNRILIQDVDSLSYAPNPHGGGSILYATPYGQLLARPFDLDKLAFTGQPALISDNVSSQERSWSASADGLLALWHGFDAPPQLTWVSRDGHSISTVGDPGRRPRISPDQKSFVFIRQTHIWMFDLTRNTSTRFTFESEEGYALAPIWSADGKSILYSSNRNGAMVLVERPANGIGPERILASQTANVGFPTAVSPDGRWLVVVVFNGGQSSIALRPPGDPSKIIRIQDRGTERDGSISPDGRWLLYSSIPATRREILVQSVPKEAGGSPNAVGKRQISTAGGSQPVWRGDGKEIFYVAPDGMMMAVPVESGENFFRPGTPKPLFQTRLEFDPQVQRQYDVTADGQRFLLSQPPPDSAASPITVIVNWPKLLQK